MKGCTKKQLEKFADFCLKGALNGHFDNRSSMLILMAAYDFLELGEFQIVERPDGTFDVKELGGQHDKAGTYGV